MNTLTRWCFERRSIVLSLWLLALVGLGLGSGMVGSNYSNHFSVSNTESAKAQDLLMHDAPKASGDVDSVVWNVKSGSIRDGNVQQQMSLALEKIRHLPSVAAVNSPYAAIGANQISLDGKTAYAVITFDKEGDLLSKSDVTRVIDTAKAAGTSNIDVALGGQAVSTAQAPTLGFTVLIGILAAAIVLFFAFGSLIAMMLPLLIALFSVGSANFLIPLLSHFMNISNIASTLSVLLGLGVSIDYALLIVTRHRGGLKSGLSVKESALKALNTSGRAVLFAGGTVCIALLGLFVLGLNFFNGVAVAAAGTVALTVFAAVTLLPALLSFFGTHVLNRRERHRTINGDSSREVGSTLWGRWAMFIQSRPRILALFAAVIVAILMVPAFSLRLGSSDQGNDPKSTTTRHAYDLLAAGFGPGFNGPLQVVAVISSKADRAAITNLEGAIKATANVAAVYNVPRAADSRIVLLQVVPRSAPQAQQTSDLITTLRNVVIPAVERGTTMRVYVGGQTASFDDFASVLLTKMPLFIAVIVLLGCLLLLIAFRSLLIPIVAGIMNLLAVAASFGVVVAFFQWGWGSDPLGLGKAGPIEAFLPLLMLPVLFGLSMDYQVFLVSRMHEEWVNTGDNARAVRIGQAETGRVVTAAASIMTLVFLSFTLLGQRVVAEFGVGLAVAVLVDAFILRTIAVPAIMHLIGRGNWWVPRWLDRYLPRLSIESTDSAATSRNP